MQGSGRSLLYGILFPIILYRFRIIFNNKKILQYELLTKLNTIIISWYNSELKYEHFLYSLFANNMLNVLL